MKTEKNKANESSCISSTVVKEEPDGDTVKIKEEAPGGNHDDVPVGDDTSECPRDPGLDPTNGDNNMPADGQNGTGGQSMIGLVKQESDHNPSDDITSDGIQPLVSNVLAKQMGSGTGGEAQYMQQQSQIFVFSTILANKGAEAVLQGQFPSIIAYHCSQPPTKKFLERHPNKVAQFRPNPAQWLNNLAVMKQKSGGGHPPPPNSGFPTEQPPDLPVLDPNAPSFWNDQSNLRSLNGSNTMGNPESSLDDTNLDVPCLVPNSPGNPANNQNPNTTIGPNSLLGGSTSPGPGGLQPSLQGVKVPDENLTPQQRQHRENSLATIRKMQMMFFAEQKDDPNAQLDPTQQGPPMPPGGIPGNMPLVSTPGGQCPNNMDWHNLKLQQQFLDGKNKGGVGSPGSVSLRGSGMMGGMPRSQGPPPPYHQTTRSASVPIATQSPNPSSPNNPTSNLSLPSPRANSALNSPADCNRQFQLTSQRPGHLPGQSPTSQDSPNPGSQSATSTTRLNHSNPGTPVSHSHLTSLSPSNTPQKESSLDFPSNQPNDNMFGRTLQTLAQQKQQHGGLVNATGVKEANLMPVPSPQQISYLNTFEGQELTIQKQPNTSLKDGNIQNNNNVNNTDMSGRLVSGNIDNNNQYPARSEGSSPSIDSMNRGFGASLHSPHTPHTPHTPGNGAPQTPVDVKPNKSSASAQSSPVPMNPMSDSMGPPRTVPASPNTKPETSPPSSKDLQPPPQQSQPQVVQPPPPQQQQQQQQQMPPQQMQQPPSQQQPPGLNQQNNPTNNSGPPMGNQMNAFPCSRANQPDNQPLDPNNMRGRLGGMPMNHGGHFTNMGGDPITSLAQMSQQLSNTVASNALGNDGGPMHSGNPGMMPFNNPHNMHMMQMSGGEMNGGCHMGGGVNEPNDVSGMCMGLGGPPGGSYSPTTSHTGSPVGPNKISHSMMSHGGMMGHNGPPGPGGGYGGDHAPPPRLMGQHLGGPSPYNGANIQVKPSAPNTIQYLPARPNVGHPPRGPPSLDFLPRFPLGSMDNKMQQSPSVNLQYFPNGCMPNNMGGPPQPPQHSVGMPPGNMGGGLPGMGPGGGLGPPRMDGGQQMNPNMHPSMRPSVGNMRPQPNMMRMQQHMVGGGVFPGSPMDPDKVFPPDMVPQNQVPNQNPGMYGPGGKGPMGLGPPPDASQPLPPSMGGGTGNFKNSPFVGGGPTMNDPNYAQQFHNFQQQLYATGTRGSGPPHPSLHPPPNSHAHQQFFMPK